MIRERLPSDEPTIPNLEDDSLHDSTMYPNNPTQPLGQSSLETPSEVPTNPNSTIVDDLEHEPCFDTISVVHQTVYILLN